MVCGEFGLRGLTEGIGEQRAVTAQGDFSGNPYARATQGQIVSATVPCEHFGSDHRRTEVGRHCPLASANDNRPSLDLAPKGSGVGAR